MPPKIETVQERLNTRYRILTIDLTKARAHPEKQELRALVYNELKILASPGAFNIILNDDDNDEIPIAANQLPSFLYFHIKHLFIKNDAAQGTAYLWLAARKPVEEGLDR